MTKGLSGKFCCSQWKNVISVHTLVISSGTNNTGLHHRCVASPLFAKFKHVFQLKLSRKSLSVSSTWSTSCAPPPEVTDYVLKNRKCMIELFGGLS